ncbi:MAG: hypothetical protein ACOC4Y_01505 [bacterium]
MIGNYVFYMTYKEEFGMIRDKVAVQDEAGIVDDKYVIEPLPYELWFGIFEEGKKKITVYLNDNEPRKVEFVPVTKVRQIVPFYMIEFTWTNRRK